MGSFDDTAFDTTAFSDVAFDFGDTTTDEAHPAPFISNTGTLMGR